MIKQKFHDNFLKLYSCHATLKENGKLVDEVTEAFGIRMLSWNKNGFYVNGKETLLRGGCVHHDNGILGAATWEKSEWRQADTAAMVERDYNHPSVIMIRSGSADGSYI